MPAKQTKPVNNYGVTREQKFEFLTQYVLNRANARTDGLVGPGAAGEAINAWNAIIKEMGKG